MSTTSGAGARTSSTAAVAVRRRAHHLEAGGRASRTAR